MSRAVLVMDMPESCDMCDFVDNQGTTAYGVDKMYCGFPGIGEDVSDCIACRPDWCPLRPMPEKMQVCGKYPQPDGIVPSYKVGWNACIDAIVNTQG